MWLRGIQEEFGVTQEKVAILCDNQSAIIFPNIKAITRE